MSGVNVLARSFRLASNRYIFRESAYMKVCPYQVMIRNCFFEETNEQHIFSKVFCNQLRFNFHVYIMLSEKFLLSENTTISHM